MRNSNAKGTREAYSLCLITQISPMKFQIRYLILFCALFAVLQCVCALPAPRYATSALVYNSRSGSKPVTVYFSSYSSCSGLFSSSANTSVSCPPANSMKMSASVPTRVSATFGDVSIRGSTSSSVWPVSSVYVAGVTIRISSIISSFPGVVSPLGIGIGAPVPGQRVIKVVSGIYISIPS